MASMDEELRRPTRSADRRPCVSTRSPATHSGSVGGGPAADVSFVSAASYHLVHYRLEECQSAASRLGGNVGV